MCVPEDIALKRRHKSKWGLQAMSAFEIPSSTTSSSTKQTSPATSTGHRPSSTKQGDALVVETLGLRQEDTAEALNVIQVWKDSMTAASSGDALVVEDLSLSQDDPAEALHHAWKDLENCLRSPVPGEVATSTKDPPRNTAHLTVAKGADIHNLWHPNQFTAPKAGHVTCTLCGVTVFAGQEATHGRGRRHSAKALQATTTPMAQCRGYKWCCWCGCSCQRWHTRNH